MKKWMTVVFASIFAALLTVPAWSQSTTGTANANADGAKQTDKAATAKTKSKKGKKSVKKAAKSARKAAATTL